MRPLHFLRRPRAAQNTAKKQAGHEALPAVKSANVPPETQHD